MPLLLFAQGPDKALEKGKTQFHQKHYKAGLKTFNSLLKQDSSNTDALAYRAATKLQLLDSEGALRDAQKALRQDSMHAVAWGVKAVAHRRSFDLDEALMAHQMALRWAPDSAKQHFQYGYTLSLVGREQDAIKAFDYALVLDSNMYRAYRERGTIRAHIGDTIQARSDLDRAVALAPEDPVNYNSRGFHLYASSGRHERALKDYKQAIKLNPNYAYAFNNRGWSRYMTGDADKGIKDIVGSLKRRGDNAWAYRNLAVIALEQGRIDDACSYAQSAINYNFVEQYGQEMTELMKANCKEEAPKKKDKTKERRSNAP